MEAPGYASASLRDGGASAAPDVLCSYCSSEMYVTCADSCTEVCDSPPDGFPCGCVADPESDCPKDTVWSEITYFDEADPGYDTRGWTSELASTALALARAGEHEAKWKVLRLLFSLQNKDGSFPDKWAFKTEEPGTRLWLWASSEHSVMRTSIVFRVLASLLVPSDSMASADMARVAWADRNQVTDTPAGAPAPAEVLATAESHASSEQAMPHDPAIPGIVRISPNPSVRGVVLMLPSPFFLSSFVVKVDGQPRNPDAGTTRRPARTGGSTQPAIREIHSTAGTTAEARCSECTSPIYLGHWRTRERSHIRH
jgi:hypothetical protein